MKYFQLLFFPALFLIYALTINKDAQGFQDIVAILMSIVGGVSAVVSITIYFATKKMKLSGKWYINLLISLSSCVITFLGLIVYSRIAK